LLALALPVVLPASDEFAVIAKKDSKHTITKTQLKKLLLGQPSAWPGGGKITLVMGPVGEASRVAALKQIAGMTEADFSKCLIHLGFIGQGDMAPRTMLSVAAARQVVQLSANSVGIVPVAEATDAVTILTVE
jgi:hypothetical protein